MAERHVAQEEVADLVQRIAEAASAYIRGDARTYFTLIERTNDYTLMAPSGGEPRRGADDSEEAIAAAERYFKSGEAELELVQSYASCDMVVLVAIERQHGEVGGAAGSGLVAARDPGLSQGRVQMAPGPPSC
jgi:hypothetical protein